MSASHDASLSSLRDSSVKLEWSKDPTKVFIRDAHFGWLPATLANPIAENDATVSATVVLPVDWHDGTVDSDHSSLRLDDAPEAAVRTVKLSQYPGNELPLQNVDQFGNLMGKSDVADLPFLHEAAILFNLKDRHMHFEPYTRVGDIIVALNPFKWIDGLYSEEKQKFYADRLVWNADEEEIDMSTRQTAEEGYFERITPNPHVYETSSGAYRGLAVYRQDQAILVSGESGAGKTETVKIVMMHLSTIQNTRPAVEGETTDVVESSTQQKNDDKGIIVEKVLQSNPVFEAFGNAKTVRNDNSSRFGKFTNLWFDIEDAWTAKKMGRDIPMATLAGSSCETYLLEKARVVAHDAISERTYHIFYQLIAADEEFKANVWEGLSGSAPESFRYVGAAGTDTIAGLTDAESWEETRAALEVFGLKGDDLLELMRALCIVLQLGNLDFEPDKADEHLTLISSEEELAKLSRLMGVESEVLQDAMTIRLMKTKFEEFQVQLSTGAASDARDALAKEVYSKIFDVLVKMINDATMPHHSHDPGKEKGDNFRSISLLDLFGFEVFDINRFEQLCINYANERLQQKYVLDNFCAVKDEYESEGIELFDFSRLDNSNVLELIEGRMGVITVLNEECILPKGTDSAFVYKVKKIHKHSECLISEKLHRPWEFGVNHFAGKVKYNATNFLERNNDKVPAALLDCAAKCTNNIIRPEFEKLLAENSVKNTGPVKRSRATSRTISSKFKKQLASLIANIEEARTRYIRCIKPNSMKSPRVTDHALTMRQLGSAGLETAITIHRETFPNRLTFKAVIERFRCLFPDGVGTGTDLKAETAHMLSAFLDGKEKVVGGHVIAPYAIGKTKAFFRSGSLEVLESERLALYSENAIVLQRWARSLIMQAKYLSMKIAAIKMQALWRSALARKSYRNVIESAVVLECWARSVLARAKFQQLLEHKAATKIQSRWRACKQTNALSKFKKAAFVIQRVTKRKQNKTSIDCALALVVEEARMMDKMKKLLWRIANVDEKTDKDELLEECGDMITFLGNGRHDMRVEITAAKAENLELKRQLQEKKVKIQTKEAALSGSIIEKQHYQTANKHLRSIVGEQKTNVKALRQSMKVNQSMQAKRMTVHGEQYSAMEVQYSEKLKDLERQLQETRRESAADLATRDLEHKLATAALHEENEKLKDDIKAEKENHADDVARLLSVLDASDDTTYAIESSNTISNDGVVSAKDREIMSLKKKIEELTASGISESNTSHGSREKLERSLGFSVRSDKSGPPIE